eukprot:COSAG02_NODE_19988_length_854_cov_0.488742_1_plen_116_part_00
MVTKPSGNTWNYTTGQCLDENGKFLPTWSSNTCSEDTFIERNNGILRNALPSEISKELCDKYNGFFMPAAEVCEKEGDLDSLRKCLPEQACVVRVTTAVFLPVELAQITSSALSL